MCVYTYYITALVACTQWSGISDMHNEYGKDLKVSTENGSHINTGKFCKLVRLYNV